MDFLDNIVLVCNTVYNVLLLFEQRVHKENNISIWRVIYSEFSFKELFLITILNHELFLSSDLGLK